MILRGIPFDDKVKSGSCNLRPDTLLPCPVHLAAIPKDNKICYGCPIRLGKLCCMTCQQVESLVAVARNDEQWRRWRKPQEHKKGPEKKCDMPWCNEVVTGKYCQKCQLIILKRKKRGWPQSRWHEPKRINRYA